MAQKTTTLAKPSKQTSQTSQESTLQVFREFEQTMSDLERRLDRMARESFGDMEFPFPLLQGLSLNRDANGRLRLQPFGHLSESIDKLFEGWRQPALTWNVGEGGRTIVFHAEVPGLKKQDIEVELTGDTLRITGESGDAKYRAEVKPGYDLDPGSAEARYHDGVLTISCKLSENGQKGRKLTVR